MSENLRNYTKALYGFDAVIRRVPADRWHAPSPCEGWSAADVVAHAAGVMNAVTQMARTGSMAMPESLEAGDDPVALWSASLDGLLEALDQPGAIRRSGEYWFGASTIDDLLAFTTWDPLAHSWDVATAAGIDACASDDVAEASIGVISANAGALRGMKLMGDEVAVPADSSPMTRFLGLTGRNPNG